MSLNFEIIEFDGNKRVVLRDDTTLEEIPVMQYKLREEYMASIKLEPGVKYVVGDLKEGRFEPGHNPSDMVPVLLRRDQYMCLSLDGRTCLIDLREEEILIPS